MLSETKNEKKISSECKILCKENGWVWGETIEEQQAEIGTYYCC